MPVLSVPPHQGSGPNAGWAISLGINAFQPSFLKIFEISYYIEYKIAFHFFAHRSIFSLTLLWVLHVFVRVEKYFKPSCCLFRTELDLAPGQKMNDSLLMGPSKPKCPNFFHPKVCSQLLSDLRETVSSEEEEKEEDGDAHIHKSSGEKSNQKGHHHYGRQQSTAPLPPPSKPPSLRRFLTDFFLRVIRPAILVQKRF